jgi:hypothetical protein
MSNEIKRVYPNYGKCEECGKTGIEVMTIYFGKPTKCCSTCAAKIIILNDNLRKILT